MKQTVITREHIREDLATGETTRTVTVAFMRGDTAVLRDGDMGVALAGAIDEAVTEGRLTALVTSVLDRAEEAQTQPKEA